ncbi:MAG: lamin tail domain-containing protein, partial [Planctomycetota bacterium]
MIEKGGKIVDLVQKSTLPPILERIVSPFCAGSTFLVIAIISLSLTPATADTGDLNPPDWAGADNTAYAHWEFTVMGYGNPNGLADYHDGPEPAFIKWNTMGWKDFKAGRQGIQKNGEARFILKNYPRNNARKKRIRVQAIYYTTPPAIEAETDDGEEPVVYIPPGTIGGPIQTYDLGDGWYHGTWDFDFDSTNPGRERISIIGSFLDEIVIDTVCYEGTDPNTGPSRGHNIGITEVFGSTTSSAYRSAMPFHMPEDGTIKSVTMYHNSSGSGNLIFGIYTGGSAPDARIAVTAQTPITTIEEWQTVYLSEPVYIGAGTKIWLAWVYENNPGIRFADGSPGRVITSPPKDWNDIPPMPDPFGGSWQDDYIVSIYATYKPTIGPPDIDPPQPNPAEWASSPGAEGAFSISMTAATATDYSGVSYCFEETTGNFGGEDSSWQESPTHTDAGLAPEIEYTYRVKTRDYSPQLNEGAWSVPASATTDQMTIVECPEGDLNSDCDVKLDDFLIFVEQWLDGAGCPGHLADCADLDEEDDGIDSEDFTVISANWREFGFNASLVINEFMASNDTKIADEHGECDDWIEIYNRADYAINMGGLYLADSGNIWEIPADVVIGPGGYRLFWADADWPSQGDTHTNFKLDKDGDEITLYSWDGTTEIDSIWWTQDQETDESYGRYPDAEDTWYVMDSYWSSPGFPNNTGRAGNVRFSHPGSTFTDSMGVGLAAKSPTATIYYTLNGDKPMTDSPEYTGGLIPINKTRRVRTRAREAGLSWGPHASETFIEIGTDIDDFQTNLPIVLIDTLGFEIDEYEWDRDYHPVLAAFIDTDQLTGIARITDQVDWAGYAGMHVRGNSSAGYDKKQYKFETWDELKQDKSVSLLGMPSESDWILHAPFSDKTLMRNHLA